MVDTSRPVEASEARVSQGRKDLPKIWWYRVGYYIGRFIEGLNARFSVHGNPMFYDPDRFEWVREIEANAHLIRAELERVMPRREEMPAFQDIVDVVAKINTDQEWKTFFLTGFGKDFEANAELCPETMKLLNKIPRMQTAFFSILSPGKHIPPHRGPYNGILRYHLGLIIPEPREQCRIRVGDRIATWEEGKSLIFDDSFNHQVWNDTDGIRVILFVDFLRPLRFPMNLINHLIIAGGSLATPVRRARVAFKRWEEKFHAPKSGDKRPKTEKRAS